MIGGTWAKQDNPLFYFGLQLVQNLTVYAKHKIYNKLTPNLIYFDQNSLLTFLFLVLFSFVDGSADPGRLGILVITADSYYVV